MTIILKTLMRYLEGFLSEGGIGKAEGGSRKRDGGTAGRRNGGTVLSKAENAQGIALSAWRIKLKGVKNSN